MILKEALFEVEVSLEGNPGDMLGRAQGLQAAGVTRVSVGVQALSDSDLKLLNRDHNVKEALQAVEESLKVFPKLTSADLIFGRPQHTAEVWLDELKALVRLGLPHLSMYQLTVERGTQLWHQVSGQVVNVSLQLSQVQKKEVELPGPEVKITKICLGNCNSASFQTMADLYLQGVELLEQLGLPRYEVVLLVWEVDVIPEASQSIWQLLYELPHSRNIFLR